MRSLWQRLRRALGGAEASAGQPNTKARSGAGDPGARRHDLGVTAPDLLAGRDRSPAASARSLEAPASGEEEAQRIYTYVRRIGPLDERPERCEPEILAALLRLWQGGREAQAVSLGGALASALPHDARLQLAVAELLCVQRDYGSAEPLLQRALAAPEREPRLRARFLLHEVALAADQAELAVTHLAHLLAEDFSYPGARARLAAVQALVRPVTAGGARLDLERPAELPALPAMAADGGLAVPAAPTLIGLPSGATARYQLLRELGCGSAGTVYLARDSELHCELALKVFHPRDGGGTEALLRALHEARLLAAVRHPGVIALYDIAGELPDEPDGSSGPPRLAMELCRGGSLRARLHSGPLPPAAALQRTAELLDTLAAVHGSGIVHGDLKPENLLFRGPELHRGDLPPAEAQLGDLVLSDFGLARLGEPAGATGRGLGTLGYAAPEQLGGVPATPASDLYAVAVVLLEMLLGEPPQRRAEALSWSPPLARVPSERWAELAGRGAPPGLYEFLAGLLAPDPAARPSAAAALSQLNRLRASARD